MSVQITYFVHGTTKDNEDGISSGWSDVELSELWREQSRKLWELTQNSFFDAVFCSDLIRAVETTHIAFEGKFPIFRDPRLRECDYGEYNGKPSQIVEPIQEKSIHTPFPHWESYEEVKIRIEDFLGYIVENYQGKHIAIVSHKAPQLALNVILHWKSWDQAFQEDWRKIWAWQAGWSYTLD